ncbi:1-aminocyclopropane-1-carboxylate deaminase/D-cysteine desulfhydrase [Dokdonia sp. Hel_I_53]|uniref:1-aminocyclopropane-1-carboxylate deaminase/D-cysteine desulfhydrase n=1 Tax=Dokdonia sp. Hel_I_53 TaxID=1566287 RepID=UPI001199E294|nr:pyridoxal-phosphate dependent enzyme [Dokdonia sp. Hel_I_53]TVZ52197.1 1-aminocyclopropane-1-carboxylate deaminase [Dokdonia sp. Hel_I_53]
MEIQILPNQFVFQRNGCTVYLKRDDLIHPTVSGNKFRKLKYNLSHAKAHHHSTIVTYGGAFSNHIAATAAAGQLEGFKTIGIIRGEELGVNLEKTLSGNPTLAIAHECGMDFDFISREEYRDKDKDRFRESVLKKYHNPYIMPEGGTNALAVKGCQEILTDEDEVFDFVCCAAGTGGTASGIINSLKSHQKALIFPALKGNWMQEEIEKYTINNKWELISDYHFGGYAKVNVELVRFINEFKRTYDVQLDPIYTGKMMYGVSRLVDEGFFPKDSRILAVHTGGLQGIAGMNILLEKKGLPKLHI